VSDVAHGSLVSENLEKLHLINIVLLIKTNIAEAINFHE
jgi:hypothetical protein